MQFRHHRIDTNHCIGRGPVQPAYVVGPDQDYRNLRRQSPAFAGRGHDFERACDGSGLNSVACGGSNGVAMGDPAGDTGNGALRLDFDRRLLLRFRGSSITSDAGLLAYRELDDTLSLTDTGAETLADARTGKNGRHRLAGLPRQSVFGRLAPATRT